MSKADYLRKHRFIPVLLFCLVACDTPIPREPETLEIRGAIMGTTYTVKVTVPGGAPVSELDTNIQARLDEVNAVLSHWDNQSDVSRFNRANLRSPIVLSEHTRKVMENALALAQKTGGAYDPTLGPLIEIWGFGRTEQIAFPEEAVLEQARQQIGYHNLRLDGNAAEKTLANLQINLSANAKGYGVDVIAAYLESLGYTDYMVEIGGEVRVSSGNLRQKPWRIGINQPLGGPRDIYNVVNLTGQALATSGDYRNFFEKDGVRYSHLIDPRTGRPIIRGVAAVSVIGPDCMTADGLATGLIIMGPEEGLELVESMAGFECLFLLYDGETGLREIASSGMAAFFSE